jgi:carboxypeptidase family protein/TonB-dependent receptor-like protein
VILLGHNRAFNSWLALALLLLLRGAPATAQSSSATLSGIVIDEAGAVVPAVEITAFNLDTALLRHGVTDDTGSFVIPVLPPARYNVTIERPGFTPVEVRNVTLNTGDQLSLRIKLKVGQIGESVTTIVELSEVRNSPSVSTVIDRELVANLPLNGRSFQSLFALAPGVVTSRSTFSEQGQFSVNGQRANANYFMVDGVSANFGVSAGAAPGQAAAGSLPALSATGTTSSLVSVDSLQEFKIQTSTYAPEFGRTPGAQISIITSSGTNNIHGRAFNYFRNDALDANDWFANSRGLPRASVRQNDFGGVAGGPLRKDAAFFFGSFEGLRLRQPQFTITEVPSLSSRLAAPPLIRSFLNAFPIPNGPGRGNGLAEFSAGYADPSTLNAASVRIDLIPSQRLMLFARYGYADSAATQRGSTIVPGFSGEPVVNPSLAQSLNNLTRVEMNTQSLTVGATLSLGTNAINELRANWSRAQGATDFLLDDFGGAIPLSDSLLSQPVNDAGFQFHLGQGANTNLEIGKNVDNLQRQLNLVDNFSLSRGRQQLKFGVDYRRLYPLYDSLDYNQTVVFAGIGSGNPAGSVLSGIARSVEVFAGAKPREPCFNNFSAYVQNTTRLTERLGVIYGVRWELNPPPRERHGNDAVTVQGFQNIAELALAPAGTRLWRTTLGNFAPRLGFAYQLNTQREKELMLRAGLGLFYDLGTGQSAQGFGSVFPFVSIKRFFDVAFPLTPGQAEPPPLSLTPPYGPIVAFDPDLQLPRSLQWNLTLEKSVGAKQVVSLAYVAALGRLLLREDALLNPNPDFTVVRVTRNAAESSYHSMQLQFVRRLTSGLQFLTSYAWSHSIDNGSSDSLSRLRITVGSSGTSVNPNSDRGPSDFDVRHWFTATTTYTVPAWQSDSKLASVVNGWSIDAIFRARTATPVNIVVRQDVLTADLIVELQRPDLIAGVPVYLNDPNAPGGRRINRAAFAVPAAIRQGSLGYNALRGFNFSQIDFALRRQFSLSEGLKLQLRAEAFNLLNRANFGNPNNVLANPQFGQSTQTLARSLGTGGINGGLSPLYQIGGPRSIQLAIKLLF